MMDIFDKIGTVIDKAESEAKALHPFYAFEPWDVAPRSQEVIEAALNDGIDLNEPELTNIIGKDPHPFQTGFMLSTKFFTAMMAGNRTGKSYAALMKALIMLTGEIPYSMRFDVGVDTGIKRIVNPANIIRFGRFDCKSGAFIDHNTEAPRPETWNEWDCGTIKGVGLFPHELITDWGSEVRIGTYQRAKLEFWWPRLAETRRLIIPQELIDTKRGANGYNKQDGLVYLIRDSVLACITYEMHANRFEAEEVPYTILDEEPNDEKIISTVVTHTKRWSLCETPYHGITYTKKILFAKTPHQSVFHCTAYDSPYITMSDIKRRRSQLSKWEMGARLWGIPTAVKGLPYFDRDKLMTWMRRYSSIPFTWNTFEPDRPYFGMVSRHDLTAVSGLVDINVTPRVADGDNKQNTWRVYEERKAGTAYILAADPAEGAETPDAVGDISSVIIARPPTQKEEKPVIVATLRSTLEVIPFAKTCACAMRYYNNSLLAAETRRGSANAAFASELRDWPYWFMMTSVQDSTGNVRQKKGFDTNAATRDQIMEYIKEWIGSFEQDEYPYIPDQDLYKELAEAVISMTMGGKQRCDHTEEGTLDSTICFGILLYVFKNAQDQIRCNFIEETPEKRNRHVPERVKVPCNLGNMGYRK